MRPDGVLSTAAAAVCAYCCLVSPSKAELTAGSQVVFGENEDDSRPVKNVAIVGAGSAGASTAYYLRKFNDNDQHRLNITVYERESYVGGRSTTVDVYDDPFQPAELGASVFVQVNRNLVDAVKEFNLSIDGLESAAVDGNTPTLGIWNGREFVFTQAPGSRGWWDTAKLFWKYGLAPLRTIRLMKSTVGKFLKMYNEPYFPWSSLSDVAHEVGLTGVTSSTGEQFLTQNSVGELFANEIVQASTRVNYAQNLGLIHGLEAMVCMAAEGAMAVEGGNWQIFAHMLEASYANVMLNTQVNAIEKTSSCGMKLSYSANADKDEAQVQQEAIYDEVILAAPKQFSNINIDPKPNHVPDEIPYVQLHVTLLTSRHRLSPIAFNLPSDQNVPEVVLTTLPPGEQYGSSPNGVGSPGFFSISTLRPTMDMREGRHGKEFLYKIFSPETVNSTFLSFIFGLPLPQDDIEMGEDDVSWMYRKVWHSYPYEYPRVTFEEIELDEAGLWYTSGIESFISTMETSSLMGMNVAKLITKKWVR
ncbi:hypothetical protein AAFC00_005870 [Neodothiora populina]